MKLPLRLLFLFAALGLALRANADTLTFTDVTFGLAGTGGSSLGSISGSVTENPDFSFDVEQVITISNGNTYTLHATNVTATNPGASTLQYLVTGNDDPPFGETAFNLLIDTATGLDVLCTQVMPCDDGGISQPSFFDLYTGLYTPAVPGNPDHNIKSQPASYVPGADDGSYEILTGTLSDTPDMALSATPEPSGFILLGSGMLGVAVAARRGWLLRSRKMELFQLR